MNIKTKLETLGYHKHWMYYGFLSIEQLDEQLKKYHTALAFPESKEANFYGYQCIEHLRHESFLRIVAENESFTDEAIAQIISLVDVDPDQMMAQNVYAGLIEAKKVSSEQIKRFSALQEIEMA